MRAQIVAYLWVMIESFLYTAVIAKPMNPEIDMNVTDVIKYYGYPFEIHEVTTEDGYILSLQRIPYGKQHNIDSNKTTAVVFLQHGLLGSSFTWINNTPKKSLGFILADLGYDVWLGNSRGNVYSRKHNKLSPESRKFWDFTWDEMAKYDLPASINYVCKITGAAKVGYVGHSQGTEIAFAKLSENGPLNSKVSAFVAMAPIAYLGYATTPIRPLFKLADVLNAAAQLLTHGEFLPSSKFMKILMKAICAKTRKEIECYNVLFLLTGIDTKNLDKERVPVYLSHIPAGTSSKNMVHYAQAFKSNKFQMYDYGFFFNLIYYHSIHPPQYCLSIKGVPIAIFYGGKDTSSTPRDVSRVMRDLGSAVAYKRYVPQYSHHDFVWAKDAYEVIYKDLVTFLRANEGK